MAEPTGVETPADDAAYFETEYVAEVEFDGEDAPSEYTTESSEAAEATAAAPSGVTTDAAAEDLNVALDPEAGKLPRRLENLNQPLD